jgi:hypothetical protein
MQAPTALRPALTLRALKIKIIHQLQLEKKVLGDVG